MKNKVLSLMVFGIVLLAVFASFASATISVSSNTPFRYINDIKSLTITNADIVNPVTLTLPTQAIGLNSKVVATLSFFSDPSATVPISSILVPKVGVGNPVTIYMKATPDSTYFMLGGTATITDNANATNTATFSVNFGGSLNLDIENTQVKGYGEDNNWYIFDTVKKDISVTNNGPEKISSIILSYGLYDTQHGKWIIKSQQSSFSLNAGNDKTITVEFNLDKISSFDSGNQNNYQFYIWVNGKDTNFNSDKTYSSLLEGDASMQFDSDFVVLNNLQFVQPTVACGGQAEVTADVVNIGSDDQANVAVQIFNSALGINQKVTIGDIDSLQEKKLDFTFNVPTNANEGAYQFYFTAIRSNGDQYESDLNNDISQVLGTLTVSGSCVFDPKLTLTASSTDAIAGKSVDVTALIKNTDTKSRTFLLTATNYDTWASLTSVTPTSLTLNAGETKQVLVKLNIMGDASGDQTFNIQLTGDGKIIPQPITVTVQKAPGFLNFLTGSAISGNWYLWAIGGLNVLLLVIIIIVAVRVSRKK